MTDNREAELEAEVQRLEDNLSALLCDLTGGRLSKTTYDVRTMVREIEAYFQETDDDDLKAAEAALVSEREAHAGLRARLKALDTGWRDGQGNRHAYCISPASLRAELAAEPAEATASRPPETSGAGSIAPVAAEEGGEQEAGEEKCAGVRVEGRMSGMLCDSDGIVRGGPWHHGTDYECTGSAHLGPDEVIVCANPVHEVAWNIPEAPEDFTCPGCRFCTPAPSGSDDTKGGATRHHHSRKAMECTHVAGDCCVECCEPGGVRE